MTALKTIAAGVAAALALAVPAAPAGASYTPRHVDVQLTWYWNGVSWVQQGALSGALAGSGRYTGTQPVESTAGLTTLHTASGTVTLSFFDTTSSSDPVTMTQHVIGRWHVVSGTGAYQGVHARGWFNQYVSTVQSGIGEVDLHGHLVS